jgi:hypothetical protein
MSFRHVAVFRWTPDATEAAKAAVADGLAGLPAVIDAIRGFRIGPDAGINEGNYDYVVVADFDDLAGYLVYRDHPAHRAVLAERIRPILAERAAIQYDAG